MLVYIMHGHPRLTIPCIQLLLIGFKSSEGCLLLSHESDQRDVANEILRAGPAKRQQKNSHDPRFFWLNILADDFFSLHFAT